jgi:hypothetical protein
MLPADERPRGLTALTRVGRPHQTGGFVHVTADPLNPRQP